MTTENPSLNVWLSGFRPLPQPSAAQLAALPTCPPAVPPSPAEYYLPLKHTCHASLKVLREPSSPSGSFSVTVFNGSDGKVVHLGVSSVDTIAKLRAQLQEAKPDWKDMSLAFNGKPVMEDQCLRDLGVKQGAMLVTFRRVSGG